MVRCAASTCSKITAPALTTATAECSVWVLPRSAASCARAPSRSSALENRRVAERQGLIGAEHHAARMFRRHGFRLLPRQQRRGHRRDR